MNTRHDIEVAGRLIEVVRKDIKNMHLAVHPPMGRISLSVPAGTDEDVIRMFAISKLSWIKKQQKLFSGQPKETPRQFLSGESHYVEGKRYLLEVETVTSGVGIEMSGMNSLSMKITEGASLERKAQLMTEWYRRLLQDRIPFLIEKWEPIMNVNVDDWQVRIMKTKWGSCDTDKKRININLELAKKPPICLEYIIVHEMVHLLERRHTKSFVALMDQFMPKWRFHREELNQLPVVHSDWQY